LLLPLTHRVDCGNGIAQATLVVAQQERKEEQGLDSKKLSNASDLYRWSCEIANGMEYLASKNVHSN